MRRWWLLALLVTGAAAATSGGGAAPFAGPDAHRLAQVTADATIGAAAVQAAVLPGRAEESRSTLTHAAAERAPMSFAALLASIVAIPVVARYRSRRIESGPSSILVALRRAVALRPHPASFPPDVAVRRRRPLPGGRVGGPHLTRTRTETRITPSRPARTGGLLAAAVGGVAAVVLASSGLSPGVFVERVTIVNPTAYQLNVALAAVGSSGSLDLGTAGRDNTMVVEKVFDPGSRWVLRLSYAGTSAGEVTVSRSELEGAGWRVEIPAAVGDRLQADGFAPSAR